MKRLGAHLHLSFSSQPARVRSRDDCTTLMRSTDPGYSTVTTLHLSVLSGWRIVVRRRLRSYSELS